MTTDHGAEREAELMFEILDSAHRCGRKITEPQIRIVGGEKAQPTLQKLLIGEYLSKVEKEDFPVFYTLTSKGLNLFGEMRKSQQVPKELRIHIIEKLNKAVTDIEIKPWEVMFHIVHVIGKTRPVTTGDIEAYFHHYFPSIKGISRASIYRNIKHLRMKGYIQCEKKTYTDQSQYRLSKKGEEVFYMTKADATRKLRTSEEWDNALKQIFNKITKEQKEDEKALFDTLDTVVPESVDKIQIIWVLYTRGSVYELKGDLDKAEETYLRMEGICEELEDTRGRAYALKGLGNVSFKKSKYAVAEQYYKRCWRIAEILQDTLLLSDVLNNVASCFYMNDDIDEALHMFEKALDLAESDTFRVASTLSNTGLCFARKEDLTKAKQLWEKSLHLYEELQETTEIKKVKSNLRKVDRKQKREYLEENYKRMLQTGTSEDIKKAYEELAEFKIDGLIKSTGVS